MTTVILGWGSLNWDHHPKFADFNSRIGRWQEDGPKLNLEYSRISASRGDALTVVIDEQHGAPCKVHYAKSKRENPEDAICDLRKREGTVLKRIGFYFADESKFCEPDVPEGIKNWEKSGKFDAVIWTGLPSNFGDKSKGKVEFSIEYAIAHLKGLPNEDAVQAAEYIRKAPQPIDTLLRQRLRDEKWFKDINTGG